MAARLRRVELDEEWRKRIQTSMLLKRLEDHVLGDVEMSATQLRAAEVLLRKSMPDLTATELTGGDGGPLQVTITGSDARL